MAKLTLLEMVVDILNDMDSDEVNSIDDTIESSQVAQILKTVYFEMISTRNWPHLHKLLTFENSGTASRPTHLRITDDVKELGCINYNKQRLGETRRRYEEIKYLDPDSFLRLSNSRNNDNDNIDVITDLSGIEILIYNDRHPTYYTTFDDQWLVFDSFDSDVDTTLVASKVQSQGFVNPTWTTSDSFVPDLPIEAFPTLLADAKSTAFLALKQVANEKAEQKATRGNRWLARKARRVAGGIRYPDFGRKGRGTEMQTKQPLDKS